MRSDGFEGAYRGIGRLGWADADGAAGMGEIAGRLETTGTGMVGAGTGVSGLVHAPDAGSATGPTRRATASDWPPVTFSTGALVAISLGA
jgi:hypothetical protein